MKPVTTYDMVITLDILTKIKKPSPRVKKAIATLEDHLCRAAESIVAWESVQVGD